MFDRRYIDNLRKSINSSPIFCCDENYIQKYNLTCAVMDRLATAIDHLNENLEKPRTEKDFLIFMMFACMVVDATKELTKTYGIQMDIKDEYQFFKHAYMGPPLNLTEKDYPTDDKFFEYFRSLTFAHPYETSRAKFIPKGQKQYSPWVIANEFFPITKINNAVGVRIYFSDKKDIEQLYVSFDMLLDYIESRFVKIELVTSWINEEIENRKNEWKQYKVIDQNDDILNIQSIIRELERRYDDDTLMEFENLLSYMSCKSHCSSNDFIIEKYKKEVHFSMPQMIEALNNFDDDLIEIVCGLLRGSPINVHTNCYYQLEKIYGYLSDTNNPSDIEWGLKQAEEFAEGFAHKWVVIEPKTMSFDEIKLLVTIACREEEKEQKTIYYN